MYLQVAATIPCPSPQECSVCSGASFLMVRFGLILCFLDVASLLSSHSFSAKVLQVAPKPPPDSGAKKDYCLIPGGYPGVSDFPHTGRSQKQVKMQFLDHLTSLEAAQVKTTPDGS